MGALAPSQAVLVRMGELTLKGRNRDAFVSRLLSDLRTRLSSVPCEVKVEYDRLFVTEYAEREQDVLAIATSVQGVHSVSPCLAVPCELEAFVPAAIALLKPYERKSFKIEARRSDKRFAHDSREIARWLPPRIREAIDIKVDVAHPDVVLFIEVRKHKTYLFTETVKGVGGLPNNSGGKILVLISGGIDSPVAAYLLARRGQHVDYVTFVTPPQTSPEALQKTVDLVDRLRLITGQKSVLHVCDFSPLLHELSHIRYENYRIVVMRRYFMRIAQLIAVKIGANALATGEALGQVASQTLESIAVIQEVSDMLVLRPLLVMDKQQIIAIAKQIGTYATSILPHEDVCAAFAPQAPVTRPVMGKVRLVEGDLELAGDLVRLAADRATAMTFGDRHILNQKSGAGENPDLSPKEQ